MAQLESAHPNLHGRADWWLDLKGERITDIDGNSLRVLFDPASAEQLGELPGFSTAAGAVSFQDCEFVTWGDFRDVTFPGRTSFVGAEIKSQINFLGAVFAGEAMFIKTRFNTEPDFSFVTFTASATFHGAAFSVDGDFQSAKFEGKARFQSATFGGVAYFVDAKFAQECGFTETTFTGRANFRDTSFAGPCSFYLATFTLGPDFAQTSFATEVDLTAASFDEPLEVQAPRVVLNRARLRAGGLVRIGTSISMAQCHVAGAPLTLVVAADLPTVQPEVTDLSDATLLAPLVIQPGVGLAGPLGHIAGLSNLSVPSSALQLRRSGLAGRRITKPVRWLWGRSESRRVLVDEPVDADDLHPSAAQCRAMYRTLRVTAEEHGDHLSGDDFYFSEMTMRREISRAEHRAGELALLSAYWVVSGYGLRAGRAFLFFAAMVIGSALVMTTGREFAPECSQRVVGGTTTDVCPTLSVSRSVIYMARASVSFTNEPGNHLNVWESWLQFGVRFGGPAMLTLGLLALRARFKR